MYKAEIGFNAGKIWNLLGTNTRWSYDDLKKRSGLSDVKLQLALGWLAREGKIEFEECPTELIIFLRMDYYY